MEVVVEEMEMEMVEVVAMEAMMVMKAVVEVEVVMVMDPVVAMVMAVAVVASQQYDQKEVAKHNG
jgi:hypothetical protein